jgi:hypothetical protein
MAKGSQMHRPKVETDRTLIRLDILAAGLTHRLVEAEDIRNRFTKAFDANLWPTRRSLSRVFADRETTDAQH